MPSAVPLAASGEQPIILERRFISGRGIVERRAILDERGARLIEERAGDTTRIIPIVTSAGQRRLYELLADPEERS